MASYNPYTNRPAVSDSPAPALGSKDPLFGFLPRKVTSEQTLKAMARPRYTRLPIISDLAIGERHQPLQQKASLCPVQEDPPGPQEAPCLLADGPVPQNGESLRHSPKSGEVRVPFRCPVPPASREHIADVPHRTKFSQNQIIVMVGETGSGKTTQ